MNPGYIIVLGESIYRDHPSATVGIERLKMKNVEFGIVKFFDSKKGFGHIYPELADGEVRFEKVDGPCFMEAGVDEPVFTGEFIKTLPRSGDLVVFVRGKDYRTTFSAVSWSYAKIYEDKVAQINDRQGFCVIRRTCLHGVWGDWTPVFEGSAVKLASVSARDGHRVSPTDQFAPVYWTGKLVTENRFQIKKGQGCFVDYASDPRPFPKGKLYRVMLFEKGEPKQLNFGTVEEIMWKHPRGVKGDKLAPTSPNAVHSLLYWESKDKIGDVKGWVVCDDPRRVSFELPPEALESMKPVEVANKVSPTTSKVSVALPRSSKLKPVVLKGFGALGNLVTNFAS